MRPRICVEGHGAFPPEANFCPHCGKQLLPPPEVYQISVPKGMKWQPEAASRLLAQALPTGIATRFRILADQDGIVWQMLTNQGDEPQELNPQIEGAIRGFYPGAGIEKLNDMEPLLPMPFYRYHMHHTLRGIFPGNIALVGSLTKVDPLAAFVQVCSGLKAGERVIYTVEVTLQVDRSVYKRGREMITKDTRSQIFYSLLTKGQQLDPAKFVPELQRAYEEKLRQDLYHSFCLVQVDAPERKRVEALVGAIHPLMNQFDTESNGIRWVDGEFPGSIFIVSDTVREWFTSAYWVSMCWSIGSLTSCRNELPPDSRKVLDNLVRITKATSSQDWRKSDMILQLEEIASLWHLPHEGFGAAGIVWARKQHPLPREVASRRDGVQIGNHTYHGATQPVFLPYPDRVTHINIVGKARTGKTTLMHNIVHQDIAQGKGVGVIDPHGDLVRDILQTSIPPERTEDVVLVDLADTEHPVGINLLAVPAGAPSHVAVSQALGIIRRIFAEDWSEGRMENIFYAALTALVGVPGATIRDVPRLFDDEAFREKALQAITDDTTLEFWYDQFEPMSEGMRFQVIQPVLHRVRRFYRDPDVRNTVCQPTSLDFRSIMDKGMIFLASMAGSGSQTEGAVIGAALISKLQLSAMARARQAQEERRPFYLLVDEVQNFTTTSLPVIFSEAPKYGLYLTVANQYLGQLEGATLGAVMGNTGTTVLFRVGPEDAPKLTPYVKPEFEAADLTDLDRFNTIVKMQVDGKTASAFSMVNMPPPAKPNGAEKREQEIREMCRARYARPRAEVEAELAQRYNRRKKTDGQDAPDFYDER